MFTKKATKDIATPESVKPPPSHTHGEAVGAIGGEVVGAIVGSMAGPPGAIAGMVIGAAAGAMVGKIIDEEEERKSFLDGELDEEIGVTSGELGAPDLAHPPEVRGAYSAASVGAAESAERQPAEGPLEDVDE
jgi:phage tail tape-measure protein